MRDLTNNHILHENCGEGNRTCRCKIVCVTSAAGVERYTEVRRRGGGAGSPLSFACYSRNSIGGRGILQRAPAGAICVEDRQTSLLPHLRDRKIPAKMSCEPRTHSLPPLHPLTAPPPILTIRQITVRTFPETHSITGYAFILAPLPRPSPPSLFSCYSHIFRWIFFR